MMNFLAKNNINETVLNETDFEEIKKVFLRSKLSRAAYEKNKNLFRTHK